jgi:hypothetical protein
MSAAGHEPIGDMLRVGRELRADEHTRRRINELLLGLEPAVDRLRDGEHDGGDTDGPRVSRATRRDWLGPLLRRLRRIPASLGRLLPRWLGWRSAIGLVGGGGLVVFGYLVGTVLLLTALAGTAVGVAVWTVRRDRPRRTLAAQLTTHKPELAADEEDPAAAPTGASRWLDEPDADADLPVDSLLKPRWDRGILAGALAVDKRDGPLDVDRMVDELARLRIPREIPRRLRRTLNDGVHVLVDVSEGMLPFAADVDDLLERLRQVAGAHAVSVVRFDERVLTHVVAGRGYVAAVHTPPRTPRAVLAITSFGLSGPPARVRGQELDMAWIELATSMRRAGCPVVALVPHDVRRVAPSLRRHIAVVQWDYTTTAADAFRAVGR